MKSLRLSSRGQRLEQFKKLHKSAGLNLVSLMDIFTILVFFLLVSSSSVQQLPSNKDLKLPTTVAKKAPKETIVLSITPTALILQGAHVGEIEEIMKGDGIIITRLQEELQFYAGKSTLSGGDDSTHHSITIMADENISYDLLRKILATCRQVSYTHVAFSAIQKAKPSS